MMSRIGRTVWLCAGIPWVVGCGDRLDFDDTHLNRAPSVSAVANSVTEGEEVSVAITASDLDGNQVRVTVSGWIGEHELTFGGGAQGETQTLTKMATCADRGDQTVTVQASDGLLDSGDSVTLSVSASVGAPVFDSEPLTTAATLSQYVYEPGDRSGVRDAIAQAHGRAPRDVPRPRSRGVEAYVDPHRRAGGRDAFREADSHPARVLR